MKEKPKEGKKKWTVASIRNLDLEFKKYRQRYWMLDKQWVRATGAALLLCENFKIYGKILNNFAAASLDANANSKLNLGTRRLY